MNDNILIDRKKDIDYNNTSTDINKNINIILLYSLSLATALGFNELIVSIFSSFNSSSHIIAKAIYVVIIFGITIMFSYYVKSSIIT